MNASLTPSDDDARHDRHRARVLAFALVVISFGFAIFFARFAPPAGFASAADRFLVPPTSFSGSADASSTAS